MTEAKREAVKIDVVVPLYNEESVVPELVQRIAESCAAFDYHLIAVDDGSQDQTLPLLKKGTTKNDRLRVLRLSRNFGHQAAMNAGLDYSDADAVVMMDGDLQDPPEIIPQLIQRWREGNDVVYAVRRKRKEGALLRLAYHLFYRFLAWVSTVEIPRDSGDFCLIDRKVASQIKALPEKNRFLRGLRSWVGYRQVGLEYEREARLAGRPKYNLKRLVNLAFDGIFSLSGNLLRYVMVIGLIIFLLSLGYTAYVVLEKLFNPNLQVQGWYSTVVLISTLSGLQLFFLGLMGEYVNRIFQEVKARPVYVVQEKIGFDKASKEAKA